MYVHVCVCGQFCTGIVSLSERTVNDHSQPLSCVLNEREKENAIESSAYVVYANAVVVVIGVVKESA